MEKSRIQYGKTDILPSKIDPKDVTVQISLKVEEDLLDALRARASKLGLGYQTLMKQMLREKIAEEQEDVSE
jgi:predicted DNA binding CopG/RHH family protein